jgi:glucosamine-6-phosphate deaminase
MGKQDPGSGFRLVCEADKPGCGRAAAAFGIGRLREALRVRGEASAIVATGVSQFEVLAALAEAPDLRWDRVTFFHLDEYVGLPVTHGASFRRFLWERFHSRLPLPPRAFHYLSGEGDVAAECARVGGLLRGVEVDVAFVGIGENGHLAFNDPPADFGTDEPYLVVDLDLACRRQQLGEGWFPTLDAVPTRALTMSIRQIMRSRTIVCTAPEARKAEAVRATVEGPVTPAVPASILQTHPDCVLFVDPAAAGLLREPPGSRPHGGSGGAGVR